MSQEQQFANNETFNQTVKFLQEQGYDFYSFKEGNPLSLLAGEPLFVTLEFIGPNPKNPKVIAKAKEILQFAKFGFTLTDHGGHLSIKHPGNPEPEVEISVISSLHGFAFSHKDGMIMVISRQPATLLTHQQVKELADELNKLSAV